MTLVVARICSGIVRVDSDSKITDPNIATNQNSVFSGVLKTIILDPKICISYAGDVDVAQKAIEKLYTLNNFDIISVKNELLKIHIESDFQTDFLIVSIENQPLLYKIQKGKVEVGNQSFWIGDIEGFELFQKNFVSKLKGTKPSDIIDAQSNAFENVISSGQVESVGGFQITVHSRPVGLEYLLKTTINMNREISIRLEVSGSGPTSVTVPIPLGNAQWGSFATSFMTSNNPYNPAIGIHFPFGNFGTLYYPRISRNIIFIKDVNGSEFIDAVKKDYRISLGGLTLG